MIFHQDSYERHEDWYNKLFPTKQSKVELYTKTNADGIFTINKWLQNILFGCLNPLLVQTPVTWLTVGDAYGFDAQYIINNGGEAIASDLQTDFLEVAKELGVITEYAAQNAEKLSLADNAVDFVLCKESYHHFPRPYAALYEMIRVSKKGIVLIEPQDPVSKMPILLFFTNLFTGSPKILNKIWKNRFSYETVGNFVYKVSEREFEKFAAALNLPLLAFKPINPNFYNEKIANLKAEETNKQFKAIVFKKRILDFLVKLKLIPGQVLSTIIFKTMPDDTIIEELKVNGYKLIYVPKNPYL